MFLALHIPDFPVAAATARLGEAAWAQPCAVLGASSGKGTREKLPLLAVNRAAREAGMIAGWPLGRALVRCPDLRILERDREGEVELGSALLALAEQVAAEIEFTRPDTVIVDLAARRNHGEWQPETIASNGCEVCWVKASTPDLADLAVRVEALVGRTVGVAEVTDLEVGEALALLGAGRRELELLELWGVRTVGDLLKLPKQALVERLGPQAKAWREVLTATKCRPLRYYQIGEKFTDKFDFEYVEENLKSLLLVAKRSLQTIESNIALKRLAVGVLRVRLGLVGGLVVWRELRLAEPQVRAEGMLAVLRPYLESLQLESGVLSWEVEAVTTFGTAVQREWFGRRELPQPERWAETVARLEAMLGADRVGVPVPPESFRPDGFSLRPALAGAAAGGGVWPELAVPLRRYRPPQRVAVAGERRGDWQWPLALLTGPHAGRISAWRGPYPGSGQWWDPAAAWQRLEWDVELTEGEFLRLAWLPPEQWQVEGIYG